MSTTRLPELPKAAAYATQIKEGRVLFEPRASFNVRGHVPLFNADQMHAYGLAVWKAAMAAGIEACQQYESKMWQAFKQGPNAGERGSAYVEGLSDGAGECAECLLALPLPEQGGPQ